MKRQYNITETPSVQYTISFTCTDEDSAKLNTKALEKNISVSDLVGIYISKGLNSRRRRDKKLSTLVELQQEMNTIVGSLGPKQKDIKEKLIHFTKESLQLWET